MRLYEDKVFDGIADRDSGLVIDDMEFHRCAFHGCVLSITERPELRSTVRNVRLSRCMQRGSSVGTAILENVVIDGLTSTGQPLQTWGAVYKHVVLKGKVDRLMITTIVGAGLADPHVQTAFDTANREYYRGVDWALDISQGDFHVLEIRGLPARLIRRDPETQIVIRREEAEKGEWRNLTFCEDLTPFSIDMMLERGDSDKILIAGKRHPKFRRYLQDFQTLRNAGIARPD